MATTSSSRWNPTSEQLYALEEIYRSGTRTPSSTQIHQITVKLRRFGKIEGKNVFYWFQNHKARERTKRRRLQLNSSDQQLHVNIESSKRKISGFEVGPTKNWVTPSNCSTISEESVSVTAAVRDLKHMMEFSSTPSTTKAQNLLVPESEREYQTLELLPLLIGDYDENLMIDLSNNDSEVAITTKNDKFNTPTQYFEFLPLKK